MRTRHAASWPAAGRHIPPRSSYDVEEDNQMVMNAYWRSGPAVQQVGPAVGQQLGGGIVDMA